MEDADAAKACGARRTPWRRGLGGSTPSASFEIAANLVAMTRFIRLSAALARACGPRAEYAGLERRGEGNVISHCKRGPQVGVNETQVERDVCEASMQPNSGDG
eukprot:GFKZ01009841.1.p6 GENE.GFKZ01009841.1~~GFKZ01009841.1.p6  ORF type:complete len:104 (+),score=5.95 GFKZ01009841.1:1553-1864(+)